MYLYTYIIIIFLIIMLNILILLVAKIYTGKMYPQVFDCYANQVVKQF